MLREINGITNQDLHELLARLTETEAAEEAAYNAYYDGYDTAEQDELYETWERASDKMNAATDKLRDALVQVSGGAISQHVAWMMVVSKREHLVRVINGWT